MTTFLTDITDNYDISVEIFDTKIITLFHEEWPSIQVCFLGAPQLAPIHQCLTITTKFHGFYILPKVWE